MELNDMRKFNLIFMELNDMQKFNLMICHCE